MTTEESIRFRFNQLAPTLDERSLRLFVASEAAALGRGGVSLVSRITGIARTTITRGQHELAEGAQNEPGRIRRPGAGRKDITTLDPKIVDALELLVEPLSRGDPESPLRWTCKSIRSLSEELTRSGHPTSHRWVWETLHELHYSLQANRKAEEGNQHVDRNAQFEHINARVTQAIAADNPVISVDTKKKELVGNYKNEGRKWYHKGEAPRVQGHDFPQPEVPRAFPYGIYDLARNRGHVVIGTDRGRFIDHSRRGR